MLDTLTTINTPVQHQSGLFWVQRKSPCGHCCNTGMTCVMTCLYLTGCVGQRNSMLEQGNGAALAGLHAGCSVQQAC
jgi:hypothetical protein